MIRLRVIWKSYSLDSFKHGLYKTQLDIANSRVSTAGDEYALKQEHNSRAELLTADVVLTRCSSTSKYMILVDEPSLMEMQLESHLFELYISQDTRLRMLQKTVDNRRGFAKLLVTWCRSQ